jgi:TPR repeat protein
LKRKLAITVVATIVLGVLAISVHSASQRWHRFYVAADNGDPYAETKMCFFYYEGEVYQKDYANAVKWCKRAADQGYAEAQFDIGHMYWYGEGVSKDVVQGYMWASLAARQNHQKAIHTIAALEKVMTSDQIAEAKRRAGEWTRLHFDDPNKMAAPSRSDRNPGSGTGEVEGAVSDTSSR